MASITTSPKPIIEVLAATSADIPVLREMIFRCFDMAFFQHLFKRSPEMEEWWVRVHEAFIADPRVTVLKALVSKTEDDAAGKNSSSATSDLKSDVAGWAIWVSPQSDGSLEVPWPEFPSVIDVPLAEAFFGNMDKEREEIMGKRPHYFLNVIGTVPEHLKKGVASALVKWGTDKADAEGLETYLDATPLEEAQRALYERRFGFKTRDEFIVPDLSGVGQLKITSMVREPKSQV